MRGKHFEAKKSILQQQLISASTAHESNQSDEFDSASEYSHEEDDLLPNSQAEVDRSEPNSAGLTG